MYVTRAHDEDFCVQVGRLNNHITAGHKTLHQNPDLTFRQNDRLSTGFHSYQTQSKLDDHPVSPPKTVSSHHKTTTCETYVRYEKYAINKELHDSLNQLFKDHEAEFKSIGGFRDTVYFGEYNYRYTGGEHTARDIPVVVKNLVEQLRPLYSDPKVQMNFCLITRYKNGKDFIPPHRDDETFINPASEIITVSLGAKRVMKFTANDEQDIKKLELDNCSVLVSSRFCQDHWKHEIEEDEEISEIRYSITLRNMSPVFLNSTALIGDSNTK